MGVESKARSTGEAVRSTEECAFKVPQSITWPVPHAYRLIDSAHVRFNMDDLCDLSKTVVHMMGIYRLHIVIVIVLGIVQ